MLKDLAARRVLDAPSGYGILADRLKRQGYNVVALDIEEKKYLPADNKVLVADLNDGFPIRDGAIDVVVSVEGIEHLPNSPFIISEWHRILAPGGYLCISTPNVVNLRSRIKFLLRGELFWFDAAAITRFGHINPQLPFILEHHLSDSGFEIIQVTGNRSHSPIAVCLELLDRMTAVTGISRMNMQRYLMTESLIYLCRKMDT